MSSAIITAVSVIQSVFLFIAVFSSLWVFSIIIIAAPPQFRCRGNERSLFMKADPAVLRRTPLFEGIAAPEIERLLTCLGSYTRLYGRGGILWQAGEDVAQLGIVLRGAVDARQTRPDGSFQIMARHGAGGLIGDLLMAAGQTSPVTVTAQEETEVLYLPLERIMAGCARECPCHVQLRLNLLREMAAKFWQQRRQIACLTESSLRRRIVRFLLSEAAEQGRSAFSVSYSREELAAFLGVNRSALSRELGRLRQEGYLTFRRGSFTLLAPERLRTLLR